MDTDTNACSRWLLTDSDGGAAALGTYTEPGYEVELAGVWLDRDGTTDHGDDLRVIRASFLDLDTQESDTVVLFGRSTKFLAVDLEADSDDDATIIKHLASDLAGQDLTGGIRIGANSYDEKKTRELAGL